MLADAADVVGLDVLNVGAGSIVALGLFHRHSPGETDELQILNDAELLKDFGADQGVGRLNPLITDPNVEADEQLAAHILLGTVRHPLARASGVLATNGSGLPYAVPNNSAAMSTPASRKLIMSKHLTPPG